MGVFKVDQLRGEIPACIRVVYDHDLYENKNFIYFLMKEKSFQPLNYYENDTKNFEWDNMRLHVLNYSPINHNFPIVNRTVFTIEIYEGWDFVF